MKVYLIPGLGFDERMFRNLKLEKYDVETINWIDPLKNETIQSYSKRLSSKIDSKESNTVLIGHSFGGIICQEISSLISIKNTILISSIKDRKENPFHFKIMKPFRLYKLFSKELTANTIRYWGTKYDYVKKEEKDLVIDMVNKQSNNYLQWALKQLSIWAKPENVTNNNLIQIHGEMDKTFPIDLIENPKYVVEGGGHFMTYNKSKRIGDIITKELILINKGENH